MATEDLTPKIVASNDSAEFLPGQGARNTTIVRFMIGRFGPFEHVFDRHPDNNAMRQVFEEKRQTFIGLV